MNFDSYPSVHACALTYGALPRLSASPQQRHRLPAAVSVVTIQGTVLAQAPAQQGGAGVATTAAGFASNQYAMRSFYECSGWSGDTTGAGGYVTHIAVRLGRKVSRLALADVDWMEAQGNYLALHVGSKTHLIRHTLGKFNELLNPSNFIRIHRSVIVAIDRVVHLSPVANGDAVLYLSNGCKLPVSRLRRKSIEARCQALGRHLSIKLFSTCS